MSWVTGLKSKPSTSAEADLREAKRKDLEEKREIRAKQRDIQKKKLEAIAKAREETEQTVQDLLALEPDILAGADTSLTESEAERLLATETSIEDTIADDTPATMVMSHLSQNKNKMILRKAKIITR